MATHGSIGEFKNAQEDWQSYIERLQQYFVANDVKTAEKQRAILLSAVGGPTYQLIRNLLAPEKPHNKTFAQIVEAVIQPKPSVIVRFNFHSRSRASGENVSTFVAELRKLSKHCNFGETLNDMLLLPPLQRVLTEPKWRQTATICTGNNIHVRDRLVCGINDQWLQRRLLSEPELTFAKALELAQVAEAAERNTRELEKAAPSAGVHVVYQRESLQKGEELIARHCATDVVVNTPRTNVVSRRATATTAARRDTSPRCAEVSNVGRNPDTKPIQGSRRRCTTSTSLTRIRTIRQTICLTSLGHRHRPC